MKKLLTILVSTSTVIGINALAFQPPKHIRAMIEKLKTECKAEIEQNCDQADGPELKQCLDEVKQLSEPCKVAKANLELNMPNGAPGRK